MEIVWNPFYNIRQGDYSQSTGPGPWKEIRDKYDRKFNSMSTDQLFHYIKICGSGSSRTIARYQMWVYTREKFHGLTGTDAAAEYKNTMISILMKLKTRLDEELQIFDDIKNVREVMVGEISLSDHTALFCVHKKMVQMSKKVDVPRINRYQSRLSDFRSRLETGFEINRISYLIDYLPRIQRAQEMERARVAREQEVERRRVAREQEMERRRVAERTEERRKRKRQAPQRLNITTTKSRSYL